MFGIGLMKVGKLEGHNPELSKQKYQNPEQFHVVRMRFTINLTYIMGTFNYLNACHFIGLLGIKDL